MSKKQICLLSFIAATFIACGSSGSSSSSSDTPKSTQSYSVEVGAVQYMNDFIQGEYEYCADVNSNYKCDTNEAKANFEKSKKVKITSSNKNVETSNIILAPKKSQASRSVSNPLVFAKFSTSGDISLKTSVEVLLGNISKAKRDEIITNLNLSSDENIISYPSLGKNVVNLLKNNSYNELGKIFEFLSERKDDLKFQLTNQNFKSDNIQKTIEDTKKEEKKAEEKKKLEEENKAKETAITPEPKPNPPKPKPKPKPTPKPKIKSVLNDTGLKKFFDGQAMVDTQSQEVNASFPDQDAKFGLDVIDGGFSFIKLDPQGKPLAEQNATTGYDCVKDERTGLIWEIKSLDKNAPNYAHSTFSLDVPLRASLEDDSPECNKAENELKDCKTSTYIAYLNKKKHCGISSWRLPTAQEQFNIMDFSITDTITHDGTNFRYTLNKKIFNDLETNATKVDANDLGEIGYWNSSIRHYDQRTGSNTKYYTYYSVLGENPSNMTNWAEITDTNKLFLRLVSKGDK